MEYVVKARNMELNDDIRAYADRKIKKRIEKFLDKVVKVEIEFDFEKNPSINLNNIVEVTVFSAGAVIRSTDSGADAFEAIDKVGSKLERQIKRYRDKLIYRGRRVANNKTETSKSEKENLRKKIVKTKTFMLKPISPEEAVMQMEMLGHDFFVFVNAETDRTAVVYRRKDNNYGLIEPTIG